MFRKRGAFFQTFLREVSTTQSFPSLHKLHPRIICGLIHTLNWDEKRGIFSEAVTVIGDKHYVEFIKPFLLVGPQCRCYEAIRAVAHNDDDDNDNDSLCPA